MSEKALSKWLTGEEIESLKNALGAKVELLSAAVVQLLASDGQHWSSELTGVACFVKDSKRKGFFILVRCYDRNFRQFSSIFAKFRQFSQFSQFSPSLYKKLAFFFETNVTIKLFAKFSNGLSRKIHFFANFFDENILKVITSGPGFRPGPKLLRPERGAVLRDGVLGRDAGPSLLRRLEREVRPLFR
jgi:hypothetical protein